jgi:bacteriocin biosynthesis cyclodehydratase domain-containing protein
MSRPTLLPGLRRLWRDRNTVQFGTDPRRAVVLEFADPALVRVLDLLDGARTEPVIIREAARFGVAESATTALLAILRDGGLVVDAQTLLPSGLAEPVRRRLAPEVAALALRGEGTPATALRRRAAARVLISGYARLAVPIAAALAQAGIGHVDPALTGRTRPDDATLGGFLPADVDQPRATAAAEAVTRTAPATHVGPLRDDTATFVVQVGAQRPAGLTALSYGRRRVPHLAVDIRDGIAMVGPLVPPAGAPCLNCVDLHRRDRDPAWPALAAQLATGPESPPLCSVTTLLSAVAYTVDEVLGYLDGGTPQTIGTTIEISGPGRERRRTWAPHPGCDCGRRRRPAAPRTLAGSQSQGDEVQ